MGRVRSYDRVNKFVQHAIDIANDDSHGYSQYHRWGPDFDCSSLMYECAYYAGYSVSWEDPRYTGAMIEDFTAAGWRCDAFDGNLGDLDIGDILLNTTYHTGVYIGNGQMVEASCDEYGGIAGDNYGDQTGYEIHIGALYNYPWTHVLTAPEDWVDDGSTPTPSQPQGRDLRGIDVSSHDQAPFKEHTEWCYNESDFVIVKITQGTWYENPCFDYQYNRAKGDGKLLGIYHYAGNEGATAEADYFYEHVKNRIGEFIPVLDWESYNNENNWGNGNWCREFCDRFHARSGIWPMIYTSASQIWQAANCANDCALWVAGYPSWTGDNWDPDHEDMPYDIAPWGNWTVWQFTSDGGTDRNVANIDTATWLRLAGAQSQPTEGSTGSGTATGGIRPAEPKHCGVQLYDANGTDAQRWKVKWHDDQYFSLINVSSGLALDVYGAHGEPGTEVWAYQYNGSRAQRFRMAEIEGNYNPGIVRPVVFIPQVNEGARLDVMGGKDDNGTKICIYTCNDTPAQQWVIKDLGDGTWVILNNISKAKALDVVGGGK